MTGPLEAFLDLPEANPDNVVAIAPAAEPEAYIWVNGWEEFQTFTVKRNRPWVPPWIKIYPALLDNPDFLGLTEGAQLLLLKLWLLFARSRGAVTSDTRHLSRQLGQRVTKQQLTSLNHAGFIRFCSGTVREQLWNTFWNRSALEVELEVEKKPQTPSRRKPKTKTMPCPHCGVGAGHHTNDCPKAVRS